MQRLFSVVCALLLEVASLSAAMWSPPVALSSPSSRGYSSNVAINDLGQAVSVWICDQRVETAQLTLGGSWSQPTVLRSFLQEICVQPTVKINASSQVLITWGAGFVVPPYAAIFSSTSVFGKPWTSPISAYMGELDIDASVAFNDAGNAVAVAGNNIAPLELKATKWSLGGAWGEKALLSEEGVYAFQATARMNAEGRIAIAWTQKDDSSQRIFGMLSAFSGSWPSMWPLYGSPLSAKGQSAKSPCIAISDRGHVVVIWSCFDGRHDGIQGVELEVGEKWSDPVDLSPADGDATMPQLALNAAGRAVAVWSRSRGSHQIAQAVTKSESGWSSVVDLSAGGQDAIAPSVACNNAGQAVAVWQRFNGMHWVVQAATMNMEGGWSPPVDLSYEGQQGIDPRIAVNQKGEAVVVWTSQGSDFSEIVASTALLPPLPPAQLTGEQIASLVSGKPNLQFESRLSWLPSQTSNVVAYRVYKEGQLIATLNASQLSYSEKDQKPKEQVSYAVSAVSSGGGESAPAAVTIH